MSAPSPAQAAVAQLNGHRPAGDEPRITPHTCGTAICPVHHTNHKPDGGWIEVHNPDHPRQTALFRGRRCLTMMELEADYAGVTTEELRRRVEAEWRSGTDKLAFLNRLRNEPRVEPAVDTGTPPEGIPPESLHVPWPGDDLLAAAHAYAEAGWYVLPVRKVPGKGYKHAGSILGKGWPKKTSRDPEIIERWFHPKYKTRGLALHVGRSGCIAFDVDHPEHLHPKLIEAFERNRPAFQSTSKVDPKRGHYVFQLPEGVTFGNSPGDLATDPKWGEVRGTNGIIVVQPTPRDNPAKHYRWMRYSFVPILTKDLGRALLGMERKHKAERNAKAANPFACSPHYTRDRVRGIVTRITEAAEGEQNDLLFWGATKFRGMIEEGLIDEQVARDLLIDVGMGLHAYDPSHPWTARDVAGTVDSGLKPPAAKWVDS